MTPRRSLFADVSAEVAGHFAVALRAHRDWAARSGIDLPPLLGDFQRDFASRATQGQRGTPLTDLWAVRHGEPVSQRLVTYSDAARMLACHERTIKRLVSSGDLRPVRIGGLVRLRVEDVDAYVLDLAAQRNAGDLTLGVPSRPAVGTETVGVGISLSRSLKTLGSEGP